MTSQKWKDHQKYLIAEITLMLLTLSKKKCDIFKFTDCIKSDSEKRDCENIVIKNAKKSI